MPERVREFESHSRRHCDLMKKEDLIRKKIEELEEMTGLDPTDLERQLVPVTGNDIGPLVARKRRVRQ